jgi:6-phosphogluconolactonase (cycloisomerase 2 family)/PKD repeat protein
VFGFDLAPDGSLSLLGGFPALTGQVPSAFVVGRDGTHLYAALAGANAMQVYTVGATGSLTSAGSAVATDSVPLAEVVSPDGTRLFVANFGSASISRFAINADGSLTSLGTATGTGSQPSGIAMTPNGKYLYAANTGDDTVSVFSVGGTGDLTTVEQPMTAGDGPTALAVSPDGAHIYAANANAGTISAWGIGADGKLTSLGDPIAAGAGARSMAISPDGTRVLVANQSDSSVSRFLVSSNGSLLSAGGSAQGPSGALSVEIAPDGSHAYVGGAASMSSFNLSSAGILTPVSNSSPAIGGTAQAMAVTPNQGPQAKFDVVVAAAGSESRFEGSPSPDSDGSVTSWAWDFGDGTSGTGAQVSHTYQQPGGYAVTLTVTDDEGCSTQLIYTGQQASCTGSMSATRNQAISVAPPPPVVLPEPPCVHDGNDGFCNTADQKGPALTILGVSNRSTIALLDAPDEIVGTVTPDPSGIKEIRLRLFKDDGSIVKKVAVTRKSCRKVKGRRRCAPRPIYKRTCNRSHGKRRCHMTKVVKTSRTAACLTAVRGKSYLVRYACANVPWQVIPGDTTFRDQLPVTLGIGSYTVDALAIDGAGNTDLLEDGRNHIAFKIIATPTNSGTGANVQTTTGGTSTPITDTGSPFG